MNEQYDSYLPASKAVGGIMEKRNIPVTDAAGPAADSAETKLKIITEQSVRDAMDTLVKYQSGKKNLDAVVTENELWWKLNQRDAFKKDTENAEDPKPRSAWMVNSLLNKHADMMDNYPEANILPREETDEKAANYLASILPCMFENNKFEATYSMNAWSKLIKRVGIYGIFWNKDMLNGLGDIDIHRIDIHKVFWEPGVEDIQDSKYFFCTSLVDNDIIEDNYPETKGKLGQSGFKPDDYEHDDSIDDSNKSVIVDWYYKKHLNGKTILHYVKFVNEIVLYASENDPEMYERGFYDHGKYPFVFDTMFPVSDSPVGFSYLDIMKSPQEYIDKMDSDILKNVHWGARPRTLISDSIGVNEEELADTEKDFIHVSGSISQEKIYPLETKPLPNSILEVREAKVDELKETSGNRDFSQGSTQSGVTAASAIAALQEAGSKTSRDLNKGSYRSFTEICELTIELIRQFYDEVRTFRIIGDDEGMKFINFDNSMLQPQETDEFGEIETRKPVFDVEVKPQRSNPFNKLSQNELALSFYAKGFFNPQLADQALACIEMMDFEGKAKLQQKLSKNQTMYQQNEQLKAALSQAADIIQGTTGDGRLKEAVNQMIGAGSGTAGPAASGNETSGVVKTDSLGKPTNIDSSTAGKARQKAQEGAEIK